MKRHNSLIPLSKEHHDVLILAQLIKKNAPVYNGLPTDINEKRTYALNKFRTHIVPHFETEERILIPFVIGQDQELDILAMEMLEDHKIISDYFEKLRTEDNIIEIMDKFGNLLSAHIRTEEREFFEAVQDKLDEEALSKLEVLLEQSMSNRNTC